jgi:hypothetical protein
MNALTASAWLGLIQYLLDREYRIPFLSSNGICN